MSMSQIPVVDDKEFRTKMQGIDGGKLAVKQKELANALSEATEVSASTGQASGQVVASGQVEASGQASGKVAASGAVQTAVDRAQLVKDDAAATGTCVWCVAFCVADLLPQPW